MKKYTSLITDFTLRQLDGQQQSDPAANNKLSDAWPEAGDWRTDKCGSAIGAPTFAGIHGSTARMIGLGFRSWVRGTQTHDSRFFDICSQQYIQNFGLKDGLVLSTKLGNWVDALDKYKKRPLSVYGTNASGFSYDEVVAISMIAACQHAECPALKACIYAITEASEIDLPQHAAQDFADGLVDAGKILHPDCIALPLTAMGPEFQHFAN